ncbi:MAG TPA: class I SAM-dependent rRNA methyltransferase [Rhodanobacteraceae bacterium]|nr:class I SAM-dependent rRNA methyltransferase [Rhodanobacteraceae bacterium]
MQYPALYLKRGEEARLRAGHLWVFANEVDVARSPLAEFEPGAACAIVDSRGHALGVGYVNPHSLIAARLMNRGLNHAVDASLLTHRVKVALALRERLFEAPYYRLLYGESDGVPGLTVDRYGDVLVAQATSAGIERLKPDVEKALVKVLKPRALVWKNDVAVRELEGLTQYAALAFGDLDAPVYTEEAGLRFRIDPLHGQKTGWFHDQRANRDRVMPLLAGRRVLDLFCHLGGWGLRAAAAGASEVVCVDASASAIEGTLANARDNGLADRVSADCADVFDWLRAARERRERFDVVVVDPPAFVKRRKDLAEGRQAYRRVIEMAMQVLSRDGLLVACSCSHHFAEAELLAAIQKAARHIDRSAQMLIRLQQGPDHPVHPAIPETAYLKGFVCRVLPA